LDLSVALFVRGLIGGDFIFLLEDRLRVMFFEGVLRVFSACWDGIAPLGLGVSAIPSSRLVAGLFFPPLGFWSEEALFLALCDISFAATLRGRSIRIMPCSPRPPGSFSFPSI